MICYLHVSDAERAIRPGFDQERKKQEKFLQKALFLFEVA